jgi:hypothetical protein
VVRLRVMCSCYADKLSKTFATGQLLPGIKNAVNLAMPIQLKWEQEYSKIGNKNTVIS